MGCLSGLTYMIFMSKNDRKINHKFKTNVSFNEICGNQKAKQQFQEIVDFLKNQKKQMVLKEMGATLKKGILLYGPPGTGKTMLAKALAHESDINFLYACASEFIEKYVGVGGARIRNLFDMAEEMKPCVVFIDEIDSLGRRISLGNSENTPTSNELNNTINQFLAELDGFHDRGDIIVIAATNKIESLDKAMLRSGRFDIKIETKLPNETERKELIKMKLKKSKNCVTDKKISDLAKNFPAISGADINTIVNESVYVSVRKNKKIVDDESLEDAFLDIVNKQN